MGWIEILQMGISAKQCNTYHSTKLPEVTIFVIYDIKSRSISMFPKDLPSSGFLFSGSVDIQALADGRKSSQKNVPFQSICVFVAA